MKAGVTRFTANSPRSSFKVVKAPPRVEASGKPFVIDGLQLRMRLPTLQEKTV